MTLLKIFLPSWRFFDRAGDTAVLYVRTKSGNQFSAWEICLKKPARSWRHLLLNPDGNVYLAYQGLVDRLIAELEPSQIESNKNFLAVKRVVESTLASNSTYQFKIDVIPSNGDEIYTALLSKEYSAT